MSANQGSSRDATKSSTAATTKVAICRCRYHQLPSIKCRAAERAICATVSRSSIKAISVMARPSSTALPMRSCCKEKSNFCPSPEAPTSEAITAMARVCITTWLRPSNSVCWAAGNSTFHRR